MVDITEVLQGAVRGDRRQVESLFPLVYHDLRRAAAAMLRRERHGAAVQPTSLVHEVYLKLVDQKRADWKSKSHFFAVGAQAMRRILVDHARRRGRLKHGAGMVVVTLTDQQAQTFSTGREEDVLTVDGMLTRLEESDARQAKIVELRFFGGLTLDEVAEAMGISRRTVAYEWRAVRAWLRAEMSRSVEQAADGLPPDLPSS
jgi:RNA polymerase sigma factor (TIGR02999 family)